jgi:hypothetical protein
MKNVETHVPTYIPVGIPVLLVEISRGLNEKC